MNNKPWLAALFMMATTLGQAQALDSDLEQRVKSNLQKKQGSEAEILLKKAIKIEPKDKLARYWLAKTYWMNQNIPGAKKELQRAMKLGLEDEKALPFLARIYLVQQDFKTMINEINVEQIPIKNPSAPWVLELTILNGDAYLNLGQLEKARENYQRALVMDSSLVTAWLGLTHSYVLENNAHKASEMLEKTIEHNALKTNSNFDADIEMMRAQIYQLNQDFESARIAYQQALDLNENHIPARVGLARLSLRQHEMGAFTVQVNQLERKAPAYPETLYLGAIKDYHQKNFEQAIQKLEKVISYQPGHDTANFLLANSYFKVKRYEIANKVLDDYLERNKNNSKAIVLSAAIKLQLNEPRKTIELLEPLVEETPHHFQWLGLLGHAYLLDQQLDKGIEVLQRASKQVPQDPTLKIELAASLIAKHEADKAEALLDQFVTDNDYVQADLMLIMVALKNGHAKKAEKLSLALLDKKKDNPVFHNLLGLSYLAQKNFTMAEKSFNEALNFAPKFHAAKNNLIELHLRQNNTAKAKEWVDKALKQDPNQLKTLLYASQIAELQGDRKAALKWLKTAKFRNPQNYEPVMQMVGFYLREGEAELALNIAEKSLEQFRASFQARHLVGQLALYNHRYEKAFAVFKDLEGHDSENLQVLQGLARAQVGIHAIGDAQITLEKLLNLQSTHLPGLLLSSDVALQQKNYQQVLSFATKIVDLAPNRPIGYRLQGDAFMGLGQLEQALEPYQKAYQLGQTAQYAQSYYQVLKYNKQQHKGYAVLEHYLENNQQDHGLRRFLATEYLTDQKLDQAKEHYEMVAQLQKDDFVTHNNLAHIHLLKYATEKAYLHAKRAYELAPNNPAVADTFAWTLIQKEQPDKAVSILTHALHHAPNAHGLRYHRAVGLHELGQSEQAIRDLEAIVNSGESFPDKESAKVLLDRLKQQG